MLRRGYDDAGWEDRFPSPLPPTCTLLSREPTPDPVTPCLNIRRYHSTPEIWQVCIQLIRLRGHICSDKPPFRLQTHVYAHTHNKQCSISNIIICMWKILNWIALYWVNEAPPPPPPVLTFGLTKGGPMLFFFFALGVSLLVSLFFFTTMPPPL